MFLLLNDGKTQREIADFIGCSLKTVAPWCVHGDPNFNLEERRWQTIGKVIQNNRGSIVAPQIAPYLDIITPSHEETEDYILPVLTRFNGLPQVSDRGDIIYYFPDLQVTTKERKVQAVYPYLREKRWKFSEADSGQIIFKESATYTLKLPLGKTYSLSPLVANFVSTNSSLNVSTIKEFTRSTVNLQATPLPYVLVKGKLMIQGTNLLISPFFKPIVKINSIPADSIKLNLTSSTYEVRLNHGLVYQMRAEASKHESIVQKLDLSKVEEYQEITQDLFLSELKMAIVTGKILDKKTNKPLANLSTARINVEGMSTVWAKIDTATGDYELKLPLASSYTINAAAPNYYPMYEVVTTGTEKTDVKIFKDLVIVPIEVGQSIRLNNIFFDPAKSILKKESFPELDRVSDFLNASPELKIEIAGHTDNVGNATTNQKLSFNRAKAVTDYVIKKGVAKDRVVAKGYGAAKPVASNKTKDGKAQNRRVEFTVLDN